MQKLNQFIIQAYENLVIRRPIITLVVLILCMGTLGYFAKDIRIDASSESLLLEDDNDLRFARKISKTYGQNDLLFVTFSKFQGSLLDPQTTNKIKGLKEELAKVDGVENVLTILDVPLLSSPPVSIGDLAQGKFPTLLAEGVDLKLAFDEFRNSPFYRDLLVSSDMKTTALIIFLKNNEESRSLIDERDGLLDRAAKKQLTTESKKQLIRVRRQIAKQNIKTNALSHNRIQSIRSVLIKHRKQVQLFLGGISMIADDMVSFIRYDLKFFGIGMFVLILLILGVTFRRFRFVILPLLCCLFSVTTMMGLLSLLNLEITVISSNFISLQLILTLALVIHLIVGYNECVNKEPNLSQSELVFKMVRSKFIPCLYASLTTIAGFLSLILSDIKPVMNFGYMMSGGIIVTLIITFILYPSLLVLLKPKKPHHFGDTDKFSLIRFFGKVTINDSKILTGVTLLLIVITITGLVRLKVENSFIDYFKKESEIYKGMSLIDKELGGTTPVDVILSFANAKEGESSDKSAPDSDDEPFDDPFDAEESTNEDKYWFNPYRMGAIEKAHAYLDGLRETGKVLSLETIQRIIKQLNEGKSADNFELAMLYEKLPDKYKKIIVNPYVSFEDNQARLWVRIRDSLPDINRNELLQKMQVDLSKVTGLKQDQIRLGGAMVLYNNMLQSLFDSQIKTLGFVALILFLMFWVLFRSFKLSLIALLPNVLAVATILGFMGLFKIPLDLMTITIGAITIGIAVDDTIHYIYRFRTELENGASYNEAVERSHATIGYAMYYTSVTITIGFCILAFSNFWPTIYFGLFTGLAMVLALIASLTLLPKLLISLKPFDVREGQG